MVEIKTNGKTTHLYVNGKEVKNIIRLEFKHKVGKNPVLTWQEEDGFHDMLLAEQMGNEILEPVKEEKKMRNVDIIENDEKLNGMHICLACYRLKNGKSCGNDRCSSCEFNSMKACYNFLGQEYKEPKPKIKLNKFEYDLIQFYVKCGFAYFKDIGVLKHMKEKGYYKGIEETNVKMQYILDNCEIID